MVRVEEHFLPALPLAPKEGAHYFVPNGNGSNLNHYVGKSGAFRLVDADAAANSGVDISVLSAEAIPSYSPIALLNGAAYKYDSGNLQHLIAFAGFSMNGVSGTGQVLDIKQHGLLKFIGWGLTQNVHYLAGISGAISQTMQGGSLFKKIVGFAIDSDTMMITQTYNPIINN